MTAMTALKTTAAMLAISVLSAVSVVLPTVAPPQAEWFCPMIVPCW